MLVDVIIAGKYQSEYHGTVNAGATETITTPHTQQCGYSSNNVDVYVWTDYPDVDDPVVTVVDGVYVVTFTNRGANKASYKCKVRVMHSIVK